MIFGFVPQEEPAEFTIYNKIQVELYHQLLFYFLGSGTLEQDNLSAARDQTLAILHNWSDPGEFQASAFENEELSYFNWLFATWEEVVGVK